MPGTETAPTDVDLRWGRILVLLAAAAMVPPMVWLLVGSTDFAVFYAIYLLSALSPLLARRESTFRATCWAAATLMLVQSFVLWFTGTMYLLFAAGIVFLAPWAITDRSQRTVGPWIWLALAVCFAVGVMTVGAAV